MSPVETERSQAANQQGSGIVAPEPEILFIPHGYTADQQRIHRFRVPAAVGIVK